MQDDYRVDQPSDAQSRAALGRVPAVDRGRRSPVELRRTTGKFVVASDDAVIDGVEVGRYLQTYSKARHRSSFWLCLRPQRQTARRSSAADSASSGTSRPGGTSSSKAQNPPFLQATALNATPTAYGTNLLLRTGCRSLPASIRRRPAAGITRSIFDVNFRDAYARQWNVNVQRALATNYMVEVAYVGSQGRQMLIKGDPNQAPPGRRRDRREREPSVHRRSRPPLRTDRAGPEQRHARLQRAAA